MSKEFPVRLVLEEDNDGKKTKYRVAWEDSWVNAYDVASSVTHLKNLKLLGITKDSDQRKIKQAKFVVEIRGASNKEKQQEVWTYEKVRTKAPELLLAFYEQQLEH